MIQNPEPHLITAGGKIRCRRCKARSLKTKLQCAKPALKGKAVCGHHGGLSTGPRTQEGKDRIRAAHWKHGDETKESRAKRSAKSALFFHLRDLGEYFGILKRAKGRRPSLYFKYDLSNYQNLQNLITQIEKSS